MLPPARQTLLFLLLLKHLSLLRRHQLILRQQVPDQLQRLLRREFLQRLRPVQREALGFPAPSSAYWSVGSLDAARRWYPKMDLSAVAQKVARLSKL